MRAFVIAMNNEADCIRPFLRADDRLYVSGVGKVNAAAATQKAICEGASEILNAGVVGGLEPTMNVGDTYEVSQTVEYDFDLTALNGTPRGTHNECTTPYVDCVTRGVRPARMLATGDRFTDDPQDAVDALALGAGLRDMEGAAIAHVAATNGVPCRMLKCVSDVHGKGAMTGQYKDNLTRALECLKDALSSWM